MQAPTLSTIESILDIKEHNYGKISSSKVDVGKWTIEVSQNIEKDDSFYSKSWHRTYGAKYTVENRLIKFSRKHGRGRLNRSVPLTSWSGRFLSNSIVQAGLAPKSPKLPLRIRLHKAFDAHYVKSIRGYKIYCRTLLGAPVDWVIVAPLGTTYHTDKYSELIRGLFTKIRANSKRLDLDSNLIDWDVCRQLGFCKTGIQEFCDLFNLNVSGQYSCADIELAVREAPELAEPFIAELMTLAKAYNYSFNY